MVHYYSDEKYDVKGSLRSNLLKSFISKGLSLFFSRSEVRFISKPCIYYPVGARRALHRDKCEKSMDSISV